MTQTLSNPSETIHKQNVAQRPSTSRSGYLDALRVIACLGVVATHVTCGPASIYGDSLTWHTANIINGMVRFCVPVFIMLSGALLLSGPPDASVLAFYKKRLGKVLLPLAVWGGVLYPLYMAWLFKTPNTYGRWIPNLLSGNVSMHLWYLYLLLFVYLAAPYLKIIVHNTSAQAQGLFVLIAFLLHAVLPMATSFNLVNLRTYDLLFSDYMGYFMMGFLIHRHLNVERKTQVALGSLVYLAGAVITILGTWLLSQKQGKYDIRLQHYTGANIYLMATGLFIFIKGIGNWFEGRWVSKLLATLGEASYGVYLIHLMVMYTLGNKFSGTLMLTANSPAPLQFIVNTLSVFVVSTLCVMVLRRIILIRRIVP